MKRSIQKLFITLVWVALPALAQAQFTYTTNSGAITITGYFGTDTVVAIPSTINGWPITSIGDYAFFSLSVTSVTVGTNITSIGNYAFLDCVSLTNITIPDSVNSIGRWAFYACASLTSITIPNSVNEILDYTFNGCASLTSVTIQNSTTMLGANAFSYCTGLTNLVFLTSVTSIGQDAFAGCIALTKVAIPANITTIGEGAFSYCTGLTNVTIPTSATNIGVYAFAYCTSLSAITVAALNPAYSDMDGILFDKTQTSLVEFPGGRSGNYSVGNGVTSIGDFALAGCFGLTSVAIPDSVTNIGTAAFNFCTGLTNVTIPNSVTLINDYTFEGCTNLSSVLIPDKVTSLGMYSFYVCNLASVTIPNSVTSIGDSAFEFCPSLTNVTIGNSVTNIGIFAFAVCPSLTSITIPGSVASFGYGAFNNCSNLTTVYFEGNAPNFDGVPEFAYDTIATVFYLPGTSGWGPTFDGLPTALWIEVPTIQTFPQTQTAEAGSAVCLWAQATNALPLFYRWCLNGTNLTSYSTNSDLELTNLQFSQSGAYTVVFRNVLGAATSAPAMLNVIPAVERRPVPGIKVAGDAASLLNLDHADSLSPAPNWKTMATITLSNTSQFYFDLTTPLPPQTFYRVRQTGTPSVTPSLKLAGMVPAITLTGSIGDSLRLDYINQFGPTDAWVTLDTITLTNTSQLYFDVSVIGQPPRLWRIVPVP